VDSHFCAAIFPTKGVCRETLSEANAFVHMWALLPGWRDLAYFVKRQPLLSVMDVMHRLFYMYIQMVAIGLQRKQAALRTVALQPGTVRSVLSRPFSGSVLNLLEPADSVRGMLLEPW
jgi:hypothetical protein